MQWTETLRVKTVSQSGVRACLCCISYTPRSVHCYMCTLIHVLLHAYHYTWIITCALLHVHSYTCALTCVLLHMHHYMCALTYEPLHMYPSMHTNTCALLHMHLHTCAAISAPLQMCYMCTLTCTLLHVHLYVHSYTCTITCVLLHCVCYMCTLTCAPLHVHCYMEATLKLNAITQAWITDSTLCLKLILSSKRCVTKAETQLQMLQSFTLVNRVWDRWPTGKDTMGPCPSPLQPEPRNWISNEMLTLH